MSAVGLIAALVAHRPVSAGELASAWTSDRTETKSRLVAGISGGKPVAGVEIALDEGWKTYWRFPGEAGGVPPSFDWAKSDNVASVTVLYPAPKRLTDKAGDTLGYKSSVVFPVLVEPKDATKPVTLRLPHRWLWSCVRPSPVLSARVASRYSYALACTRGR